MSQKTW